MGTIEDNLITDNNIGENLREVKGNRNSKQPPPGVRQNYTLRPIIPNNDALFEYYRKQGIIGEDEWDSFKATLTIELPASFRIQLSLSEREDLAKYIESKFISEITTIVQKEGAASGVDPPKSIPFIPYGYQTKMSRAAIRSHPILKDFHEFLINETELGYISRQELCSMIPPLLLDIQPQHIILDACAAPGSKTMQILELMHKEDRNPEGLLVANDVDYKRCYLLVHQTLKRMFTASCVVTSHDSSQMPAILDASQQPILFDRILCDVICSGDGTFRKNAELWRTWEPMKGVHLHKLQLQIARRCFELLQPGGLMCYSTCSLNPLEDEAVVAQIIRTSNGTMELVDVSNKLDGLRRSPGVNNWKVLNKELKEFATFEDVPPAERRHFKPSMFPPSLVEAQELHLERCFRILPHHQDTGGFFVALLQKKMGTTDDQSNKQQLIRRPAPTPAKRRRQMNKEDPFVFLEGSAELDELRKEMATHFGVSADNFPYKNILVRSNKQKEVYFANNRLREFLLHNEDRFKIVNAGLGILKKITSDKVAPCSYRLKQDGLFMLSPWINKRCLDITVEFFIKILKGGTTTTTAGTGSKGEVPSQYVSMKELGDHSNLFANLDAGSVVLRISEPFRKEICAWIGANSVSAFVSREERFHLLSILGEDTSRFRRQDTTRQEKAKRKKVDAIKDD